MRDKNRLENPLQKLCMIEIFKNYKIKNLDLERKKASYLGIITVFYVFTWIKCTENLSFSIIKYTRRITPASLKMNFPTALFCDCDIIVPCTPIFNAFALIFADIMQIPMLTDHLMLQPRTLHRILEAVSTTTPIGTMNQNRKLGSPVAF